MTDALKAAIAKKTKPKVSDTIGRDLRYTPAQVMADLVGCSTSHLARLVKKGEISQVEGLQGKYNAYDILAYFRQSEDATTPMQQAKLAEVLEKTRKDKLHNDEKDGLLIRVEEVAEFTHTYAGFFIKTYESIRKRVGALVDTTTRITVDEEFRRGREDLSLELEALRDNCTRASDPAPQEESSGVG